jgi:hypothetical protein
MDLATARKLDTVQTVESRYKRVRVIFDVRMVILEDRKKELGFGVMDGFDDESVIA